MGSCIRKDHRCCTETTRSSANNTFSACKSTWKVWTGTPPSIRQKSTMSIPPDANPTFPLSPRPLSKNSPALTYRVEGQRGPSYLQLSNFPLDGVLLENHPLLTYYHWFWTMGSGWEPLQSDIAKTYQRHWGDDFVSIHPPATRCPPYWGGGGEVSWVQNWTYINPNPSRILLSCDELRALAKGRPGQKIFNSIQGIAYRRDLAPRNVIPSPAPAWLENEMDSSYISPAPDAIREAFWCLLSRQVAAIGTFGTGSLFASTSPSTDHRFTNPESGKVFSEMIRKVMQPLSPMLLKLPEIEAEIAILESFSNVIFGGNHTNSWSSGRIGDLHMALQYAGLQTSVVYEDELLAGGGGRLRLLFLPGLETVSAALHARLQELQKAGLILVGDELTYAALTPDFRLHSLVSNPKLPQRAKQQQQAGAKQYWPCSKIFTDLQCAESRMMSCCSAGALTRPNTSLSSMTGEFLATISEPGGLWRKKGCQSKPS